MILSILPSPVNVLRGSLRIRTQIFTYLKKVMRLLLETQQKKTKKNKITKYSKLS